MMDGQPKWSLQRRYTSEMDCLRGREQTGGRTTSMEAANTPRPQRPHVVPGRKTTGGFYDSSAMVLRGVACRGACRQWCTGFNDALACHCFRQAGILPRIGTEQGTNVGTVPARWHHLHMRYPASTARTGMYTATCLAAIGAGAVWPKDQAVFTRERARHTIDKAALLPRTVNV